MTDPYPEESQKLNIFAHLEELRRRILLCLGTLAVFTVLFFSKNALLLRIVKRPLSGSISQFIFVSPTEAFTASVKLSLLAALVCSFPVILYHVWGFLAPAVPKKVRPRIIFWLLFSLALFLLGVIFSYTIAIPFAMNYLLSFGREVATPMISIDRYISFFTALTLMGGFIFEIPIVIGMLADIGLVKTKYLAGKRLYAILGILIISAVITPTQDVFNMLLFACPMWLLYEAGILIARIIEFRKRAALSLEIATES